MSEFGFIGILVNVAFIWHVWGLKIITSEDLSQERSMSSSSGAFRQSVICVISASAIKVIHQAISTFSTGGLLNVEANC